MICRLFSISQWRVKSLAAVAILAICFAGISQVSAVTLDGSLVLVPKSVLVDPVYGGTFSSYTYDAVNDAYYVNIFGGTSGLRKIWRTSPGDPWQSSDYVLSGQSTTPSDQLRFIRSSDVAGGQVLASDTGTTLMSSILLNPTAVTVKVPAPANYDESFGYGPIDGEGKISITYAPGALAFITDGGTEVKRGTTSHFDWTKKVYRWDLRAVGTTTTVQPDYDTGTSGDPGNPNPGGLFGAYGQADWNDVFTPALTEQALRDAYNVYRTAHPTAPALPTTSNDNFGRQFAWSSDGKSLYAVDSGTVGGGVYKISATQGTATLIYSEPETGGSNVIGEPAVVATSTHDFGAGFGAGDQIFFDGTTAGGNAGGISYIVDTDTTVSTPQVLLSGATFRDYAELTSANNSIRSIASDSSGNVYFYENDSYALHKLDTQGRLSVVLNKAQIYEVSQSHDGVRDDGGGLLRLQVREDSTGTWVTWRGDNSYIGAVHVFDTGDFDHDGSIAQADKDFFITQYNKTFHGNAPLAVGVNGATIEDYVDYIRADVNGSSKPVKNGDGALEAVSVTFKDLLTLNQFIVHKTGDFNWDGSALNGGDWSLFASHYDHTPSEFSYTNYSWFDGDVTFDGLVDENDYRRLTLSGDLNYDGTVNSADEAILQSHFGENVFARNAALGEITEDGFVNNADLAILQAHLGQSLVTWNGGGGDNHWSSTANWTGGRSPQYAGDKLVFSGTNQLTAHNDLPADTVLNGIIFKFDAGSFTLLGNRVTLSEEIVNQSGNNQTVALDIHIGGGNLIVDTGDAGIDIDGIISESVAGTGLIKVGTGMLTLAQTGTISGTVEVREGNMNLLRSLALASEVEVSAGAELTLASTSGSSLSASSSVENNGEIHVAAMGQTVGSILGTGSVFVQDGASLTATSIVQSSLIIGGTAQATAVPEPCTILQLLSIGLVCGGLAVRNNQSRKEKALSRQI